jgi:hypothetical protein
LLSNGNPTGRPLEPPAEPEPPDDADTLLVAAPPEDGPPVRPLARPAIDVLGLIRTREYDADALPVGQKSAADSSRRARDCRKRAWAIRRS